MRRITPLFLLIVLVAAPGFAAPAVGVTNANTVVTFDTASPGTIGSTVPITGLQVGETVVGIDYRPATGQLFALGSASRLYSLNPATGVATFLVALNTALSGTTFGADFNPTVDRLRIVSDAEQNLRTDPNTGGVTVDTPLAYATGDANAAANPNLVASAYLNSFPGATTTTLYGIDTNLDILVTQIPPNSGTLNTVGALGVNTTGAAGFDIQSDVGGLNTAFAALQTGAGTSLYTVNLATGATTLVGAVGGGLVLNGFAVLPGTSGIPTMSTTLLIMLALALVAVGAFVIRS
jgi:hypothetical protein